MSYVLETVTQIRWPKLYLDNGGAIQLRMNINSDVYNPPAADVLELNDSGAPAILGDIITSQKYTTTEGRTALDNLDIELYDRLNMTGTINGTPVSDDYSLTNEMFLDVWFRDKSNPYTVWIDWYDSAGNLDNFLILHYDANNKPQKSTLVVEPHTADEAHVRSRKIQCVAVGDRLDSGTWQDVLNLIGPTDCINGGFFGGFVLQEPNSNPSGGHLDGYFAGGSGGLLATTPMLATLFDHRYDKTLYNCITPNTASVPPAPHGNGIRGDAANWPATPWVNRTNATDWWGPVGTWAINFDTLVQKIATAINYTADTLISSYDVYSQEPDAVNFCYPVATSAPVDPTAMYLCLNVYAGSHPYDGSYWENPCAFKPEQTLAQILQYICDFFGLTFTITVDAVTKNGHIAFSRLSDTPGALPTNWTTAGEPEEQNPAIGPTQVVVNNMGDTLKITCPATAKQDNSPLAREIPFRLKSWGGTRHRLADLGFISDAPDCMTWDGSKTTQEQADDVWQAVWTDSSNVHHINPNCWKGLCYVFWFGGNTPVNRMYPAPWTPLKNDFAVGVWNYSFYALGVMYKRGETPVVQEPNLDRFNSRVYPAVVLATYALRGQQTFLQRQYHGVAGDDGKLSSVKLGFTSTWWYDRALRTFVAIELQRALGAGGSAVKWQLETNTAFPLITEKVYTTSGSSASTSSSSGSDGTKNTGSTGVSLTQQFPATVNSIELYSNNILRETFLASVLQGYDPVSETIKAQYAFRLYNGAGAHNNGHNSVVFLTYKGNEHGNCYIDGISPIIGGVHQKDYWYTALDVIKTDVLDTNQNAYYDLKQRVWSEDYNTYLNHNFLGCVNPNRRVFVKGIFKISWGGVSGFGTAVWLTMADAVAPMSNLEILRANSTAPFTATGFDVDFNAALGPPVMNPVVVGGPASNFGIQVNFGERMMPVAINCMAWKIGTAPTTAGSFEVFAMPVMNGRDAAGANVNSVFLQFGVRNYAGPAPFVIPYANNAVLNTAMTEFAAVLYVDLFGLCEIRGEDATAS